MTDTQLAGIPFRQARWMGGAITPRVVILHDTASSLGPGNAARYLADNDAKVSVHFVIERDGAVEQQVPLDREAWHAGRSHYHGHDGVNGFSIGIEIVNPGRMTEAGDAVVAWWGDAFLKTGPLHERVQFMTTPEHGPGWWMGYPPEQLRAVMDLLARLFREVPSLEDIRSHWYVSPGRKVDTNPLFPLEQVRARVLGRDNADLDPDGHADATWFPEEDDFAVIDLGDGAQDELLNMRRWPSFNPNVVAQIPHGTVVPVQREGMFNGRHWLCVVYGGQEGWIVARYAAAITQGDVA